MKKKIIIKINQHCIFNNAVVIIDSFRRYWDAKKNILGDPKEIEKAAINGVLTLFRGKGQKHLRSTFSSNYCRKAALNDYFNGL